MKKKLLPLFLTVCVFILCLSVLVACDFFNTGSDDNGSGGTTPTYKNATITVKTEGTVTFSYDDETKTFTLPEGSDPMDIITKDVFTVLAHYSDNSAKTITDYTLSISGNVATVTYKNVEVGRFTIVVLSPDATYQSATVTVKDSTAYSYDEETSTITLPEGSNISSVVTKSIFTVRARYSDNSSKVVTDYTLTINGNEAVISYNGSVIKRFTVEVMTSVLPFYAGLTKQGDDYVYANDNIIYTGSEIDVADFLTTTSGTTLKRQLQNGYVSIDENLTRAATDANFVDGMGQLQRYYILITAREDLHWEIGGEEVSSIGVWWQINPKTVELAAPTVTETSFVYDGTKKELAFTFAQGAAEYFDITNNGGDQGATDAGEYTWFVYLKTVYQNSYNYIFVVTDNQTVKQNEEVESVQLEVEWEITRCGIPLPAITNALENTEGETPFFYYEYTGEAITVTTNLDENAAIDVIVNNGAEVLEAGDGYSVDFQFKNELIPGNYMWADGTDINGNILVYFKVIRDAYELPEQVIGHIKAEGNIVTTTVLAVALSEANANDYAYLTAETLALLDEYDVLTETSHFDFDSDYYIEQYGDDWGNYWYVYNAGTFTRKYNFYRDEGSQPVPVEIEITINRGQIAVTDYDWYDVQYANNWNTYPLSDGKRIFNDEGQASYLIYGDVNDGVTVTYKVYYKATENGEYGAEPVETATAEGVGSNGERNYYDRTLKDAGYYKTVVTLSKDNYDFVDGNGDPLGDLTHEWVIDKAKIYVYAGAEGTFGPYTLFSYYTGSDKTIVYSDANLNLFIQYGGGSSDNVGKEGAADYIEYVANDGKISATTYYKDNGEWVLAENTSAIGEYKSVMSGVSVKEAKAQNFVVVPQGTEWKIISNEIDASAMSWVGELNYEYGYGDYGVPSPYVTNVPEGLYVEYTREKTNPGNYYYPNPGTYSVTADFSAYDVDGSANVIITYPNGWSASVEYPNHFTIHKHLISKDDFYLAIVSTDEENAQRYANDATVPYEEGKGYYDMISSVYGINLETNESVGIYYEIVENRENNNNKFEVGDYVISGYVRISQYYAIDTDTYTVGWTYDGEQYVKTDENTEWVYDEVLETYVLELSYTWHIAVAE